MESLDLIKSICSRISLKLFDQVFQIRVERDFKDPINGRIFVQTTYDCPCNKTGEVKNWHGRKWYLSDHMTEDEVIKTCYGAFQATISHEMMEGFKVDNIILFNPHINYKELLKISHKETQRKEH